ncbi:MAG TPA: hypothetical protein VH597_15090 [Verrucomicrobiae bacterium]|jgi:hypothetical protein|nr:hypothetical protein [Verrucomicrobiae bacterium]
MADTFTDDESKALFTRVFDRMVLARWIHHYTFTDGKGFRPAWTAKGSTRTAQLSATIKGCGLDEGDKNALIFDKLMHGEPLPKGFKFLGKVPEEMAQHWREGVAELKLRGDEDGLLAMVHIIEGWKPDADTPIEFGAPDL